MSKADLARVNRVVNEARRLSTEMRTALDALDSVLDAAHEQHTDEISKLEERRRHA